VLAHDPGDLVASGLDPAPAQLEPGLAGAVDTAVAGAGRFDLSEQLAVAKRAAGRLPGSATRKLGIEPIFPTRTSAGRWACSSPAQGAC
jgi:hypothetical protein